MSEREQFICTIEGITLKRLQLLTEFNNSHKPIMVVDAHHQILIDHLINTAFEQVRRTHEYIKWVSERNVEKSS